MRNTLISLFLVCLASSISSGCGAKAESKSSSSDGDGNVVVPPPEVDTASPMAVQIYTKYDNQTTVKYHKFVETGTNICEVTAAAPVVTCTVRVEEGRLYYSSTNFQFAWLPSNCKLMTFQPYSYQASASAGFAPPWTDFTTVDCSATPIATTCFGGAAKGIVPGFPKNTALLYTPDDAKLDIPASDTKTAASGWSQSTNSNRHAASDLAAANYGTGYNAAALGTAGDNYLANTFSDYVFSCRDDWADPQVYQITIKVTEDDSSGVPSNPGANNDFTSWKEL